MTIHPLRFAVMIAAAALLAGCSAESKKARALERAGGYYRAGDFEKAQIEYQNVLQKFPDDVMANERMALIWFERGATMRALAFLSRMHKLAPGNLDLRLKRAQLIASLGKAAEARAEAVAILEKSSNLPDALVLLTETIRDREDFKTAEKFLQDFADKNTVPYQIAAANLALLGGDVAKTKAALQRALVLDAKSPAAHSAMAAFLVAQNNAAQAAAEHKLAAELSPLRSVARVKHAGFLAQTGAVPEAIAALTEITRKAPDYLPAWRALAQIALSEKRYNDCLAFIKTILARDAMDLETQILRARVWLAQGDTKRAIDELQRLGGAFAGLGAEKYQLALAHLQNNDPANAIGALQQTVAQYPDNIEAILLLAQLNLRAGAPEPAAAAMAGLLSRRPGLLQAHLLLIEAAKALGKLDDVVRVLTANLEKTPGNAMLHYVLGLAFVQQGKPAEARQSFEKALESSPDVLPVITELVSLDMKEGKTAEALQRVQALIAKAPKLAAAHFLAARVHAAQGKWIEVETAAIDTINLDRNHSGAYGLLTQSFTARKTLPGIVGKVEAFLANHADEPLAVMLGARFYVQTEQFTKARDLYEKHLATHPTAGVMLNNLANLYSEQLGQPDRGLELARKARELEPTSPVVADTLGWILYRKKNYQEALPLLQESAKSLPGNPEVQFHLGLVHRALANNEAAVAALRIAAAAPDGFPDKAEAKRQLAELESSAAPSAPPPAEKPKGK